MRRIIYSLQIVFAVFFVAETSFSQSCTVNPPEEAVFNGDFELGYLQSAGTQYSSGDPIGFQSDLNYAGDYPASGCIYGFGGRFGVATNLGPSGACGANYPYLGAGYPGAVVFEDHTPSQNGDGFALLIDFVNSANQSGLYTGGFPIGWLQRSTVYPNEVYQFSAWFSNYTNAPGTPELYFVVTPYNGATLDVANRQVVGTANPTGVANWQQFSGSYTTGPGVTEVQLSIEVDFTQPGTDPGSGADFAFDDISFINGCDNLVGLSDFQPEFGVDTVSLCLTGGDYDMDFGQVSETFSEIKWFEVDGAGINTEIIDNNTAYTNNVTLPGTYPTTYRVCTKETGSNCLFNDYITITDEFTAPDISDVELCTTTSESVDLGITFASPLNSITWEIDNTVQAAWVNQTQITATEAGTYEAIISGDGNCDGTVTFDVTSLLPTADPDTFEICSGNTVELSATPPVGGSISWYDAATNGTLLQASSNTYTTPVLTSGDMPIVYYAENAATDSYSAGYNNTGSTFANTDNVRRVDFTADIPLIIESVDLRPSTSSGICWSPGGTQNYTIELYSGSGAGATATGQTVTQAINCGGGAQTVALNFNVAAAGNYQLRITTNNAGTDQYFNPTGLPTSIVGVITVDKANNSSYGGPFFNWEIGVPKGCTRVSVTVVETPAAMCCFAPGATVAIQGAINDTIKACDDTTITASISGGGSVFQWYQIGTGTLGAEGGAPGATETSGTISTSGWYSIHVADNSAGLTSCADGDTVYVLITATPTAPSVTTPVNICTGEQLNLAVTSPNGTYTYNWTGPNTYTATGATPTVIASATLTPTDHSGTYSVTATENGCTSTQTDVTVNITQGPTIADINVDTTFCAYNFDLSTLHGAASNGTITYHGDAPGYTNLGGSTVSADGTYYLIVTDAGCADTTAVTTLETGDPTGTWSGGTGVCTGNSTDLTLAITGGTGPFTVYYHDGTAVQTATNQTATDVISLGAGTYTLDSVVDNNGCSHLNIADVETIATQDDIAATISVLCTGETGADGTFAADEFQIMVDITAGDTGNVVVEEFGTSVGVSFGGATSPGIWHSGAIDETQSVDIRIHDNRCDTILEIDLQRVCSCPGVATLTGAATICNNETTDLTITLAGVGPFDFELHQNGVVYNGGNSGAYTGAQTGVILASSPITVTIPDSGTYTIVNLIDNGSGACEGSEIGSELVAFYTHPDGDIGLDPTTGENPICLDGNTDVDIEVTAGGVGPFTAYYTDNGSQSTGATTGTGIGTINITADTGTVVLDSIVDVNGCASPINESLTITAHDTLDVTATIVCDDDAATPGLPNDGFYIEVTTATGVIDAVSETSANGLTFTNSAGTWTSGVTNETNSVDISVIDDNGCHTVTITGLQQTCSCPIAAVLGYATNGEACEGGAGIVLEIDTTAGSMNWTDATVTVTGPNGVELNAVTVPSIPHQFTVADSGEYTLTVFTDNGEGCNAQLDDDTATAVIYSLPTGTLTGGSVPCIGGTADAINLYLTGAGSSWNVDYTQTNSSGTVADDDNIITSAGTSTLENATSTPADSGTYTITSIEMTAGNVTCTATDLGNTSYIGFTTPPSVSITGGGTYCDTEAPDTIIATITAGSSGIPNWTLVYYEDGAATTSRVTATTNPYNFITSTDLQIQIDSIYEGTCGAQVTGEDETITYVATPIPSITVISDTCEGSQVTAIANVTNTYAGMVYNWDVDGVTASETYPDSNYSFTINLPATGTTVPVNLSVDAPAACGSATQTATTQNITVTGQHGASITTGDLDICKDSVGTLIANDEGTGVSYTWTLNTNPVSTTSSVGVTNTPGVYTLTTSSAECPDRTATATVTVTEITVTAVATPEIVSEGDNITFSTTTNGTSCEWFDPSLNSIGASCTETYAAPAPGGIYTVISTDGQCVGTDQIDVTVIQPIKVPDAFTPNDDQVNDEFTIIGINTYDGATVSIYNRWGNLVYYVYGGENYEASPWDGKMNGKELPAGVYYYTIDLGLSVEQSDLVPDSAPVSGSVMLLK